MDTSKEYIAMADCPEIQEMWKPISGDIFMFVYGKNMYKGVVTKPEKNIIQKCSAYYQKLPHKREKEFGKVTYKMETIWLPRQDQLQEMILDDEQYESSSIKLKLSAYGLINKFGLWTKDNLEYINGLLYSMEQLWLAFVMKEKYNKIWNGSEWLKESGG